MIFSENRFPLFGIMHRLLPGPEGPVRRCRGAARGGCDAIARPGVTRGAAASPACPGEAPGEDQVPTAPDDQTLGQLHRARQALVRESESTAKSGAPPVKSGDSFRCVAASIGYR